MILVDPFQFRVSCDRIHPWSSQFCLSSDTKNTFKSFWYHTDMSPENLSLTIPKLGDCLAVSSAKPQTLPLGLWDTSGASQHPEWPTCQILETQSRAGGCRYLPSPLSSQGAIRSRYLWGHQAIRSYTHGLPCTPRDHSHSLSTRILAF